MKQASADVFFSATVAAQDGRIEPPGMGLRRVAEKIHAAIAGMLQLI